MKRLYFFVIYSTLLELDARFGERCKPMYTALTTLSANGNDFLDVKKKKPLLELIPDLIIENDLCHEVEVPKPLIISKITQGHIFQNIAAVQKVVVTYKEVFPMLYRVLSCAQTFGASTAVCVRRAFPHLHEQLLHTDGQCPNNAYAPHPPLFRARPHTKHHP